MKKSKSRRILEYLYSGHTLTLLQSLKRFGDFRLASIVCKANKRGWRILAYKPIGEQYSIYRMPLTRKILIAGSMGRYYQADIDRSENDAMARKEFK